MYQRPTGPLSIGGVLDHGFQLFRASFQHVFLFAFVAAMAGQIPNEMLGLNGIEPGEVPAFTIQAALAMVAAVLIGLMAFGAIVGRIDAVASGSDMSAGEALQLGLRRGPVVFVVIVIYVIAIIVGSILLIIPGIIVSLLWFLAGYVAITKSMGPFASISYSSKLIWGYWWRTAALVTIAMFVLIVVYVFVGAIVGFLVAMDGGGGEVPTVPWYINLLVLPLIGAVGTPFLYAMSLSILYDLELRRSGEDLAARIDASND